MDKLKLLQEELKGLDVEWKSHGHDGAVDMARINGHSIIWHEWAMADADKPEVEVYFVGDDQPEGHVPIKGLRQRVGEQVNRLFVYGIFLNEDNRAVYNMTNPRYAVVKGYKTVFIQPPKVIGAVKSTSTDVLSGLLVNIDPRYWRAIDMLEQGYDRILIRTTLGEEAYMYVEKER